MKDYFDDFEFNIDIEYEEEDYDWDYDDYYYDDWNDDYYYDYSPRYNYRDYDYYDYSPSYNYNQRNNYTQNNSYTENNYTQNNTYNQNNNYTQNNSYTENNYTQNNTYVTNNYYNTDNSGYANTSAQSSNSIIGYVRNYFTESFSQFSFSNVFSTLTSRRGFGQSLFGSTSLFNFGMQAVGAIGGNLLNNWLGNNQTYSYAAQSIKAMTLEGDGNKEVWLANESEEVMINAVNTYGSNVLAGNNKNNQIFGGNGNNQMWGGSYRTNDYLFGGEGQNTFWYGKGEGIDLVENTKTGDTINLYNINLDDISNLEITDSAITLVVGEDQGIGVTNSDEVSPNFKLANGETYNYNRTVGQWQQA